MKVSEQLATFAKEALAAGRSRDEIRSALKTSGWMDTEVDAALAAWSDVEFTPPVPSPRPYVSAREAFYFILMYVILGLTVWALIELAFTLVEGIVRFQGGANFQIWMYGDLSTIRWTMSELIIVFPIFLAMNIFSQRQIEADPAKQRSQMQKWLGYLALAVASLSLVGDAVWIVFGFISGSLTDLFWYRALIVAVVAASVLLFFIHENREPDKRHRSPRVVGVNVYQAIFLVLVGLSFVGGWLASNGMAGAQIEERDNARARDLQRLAEFVDCVADGNEGQLPSQLTNNEKCRAMSGMRANDFGQGFEDRYTGERYSYLQVSAFKFQVCAKIERPEAANSFYDVYSEPWACAEIRYRPPEKD